eukprot:c22262_g2_i1 orf=527-2542(-)
MGQSGLPPGYRFSPTDGELLVHYLRPKTLGRDFHRGTIAEVDVYKFEPWDLPEKAVRSSNDLEWYFFSSQDKKYSHTARINRTTFKGYWKATGKDRKVLNNSCVVGWKKTLIYYEGRAPNGSRTNWIMHEYRLDEESEKKKVGVAVSVVCRIRKKDGPGPRNGAQYGAPIGDECGETEEDVNAGNVGVGAGTGGMGVVKREIEDGGNVFNLQNQVEVWKLPGQMEPPKVALDRTGNEDVSARNGINECETEINEIFQSISDLDVLSNFPTLLDVNDDNGQCLHDYGPTEQDESGILNEMMLLVGDSQGGVSSRGANENMVLQADYDVPFGLVSGGFIELDDIKTPLDGFASSSSLHSSGFGWPEEQMQCFNANTRAATCEIVQVSPHSQGVGARLRIPVFNRRPEDASSLQQHSAAYTMLSEVEKQSHGGFGDISIPIARESNKSIGRNFTGSYPGPGFNSCDTHHVLESSTKSFLSKHTATYAVSKCQVVPAQLCYASLTDSQDGITTAVLVKEESNIDTDGLKNGPAIRSDSSSLLSLLTETNTPQGSSDVEDPSCSSKFEHAAGMSSLNARSWKKPFKGLVSKAKQSVLGTRLLRLESGMRAKFSDKFLALGKPAARLLPMEGSMNPYDSLRKVVLATLCHLAAAVLIFFCLFWGFRILTNCAFSVLV